jgi:hypothetical protein
LNIIFESIDFRQPFGRIAAALIFSIQFSEKWGCALRIITSKEPINKQYFLDILAINNISLRRNIEFLTINPDVSGLELPVGKSDFFLTTSWITTARLQNALGDNKIIYFLQEDESKSGLVANDYLHCLEILKSKRLRFIVSTRILYEHLVSSGLENIRENGIWFEPAWPDSLFFPDPERSDGKKNFLFTNSGNSEGLYKLGLETINKAIQERIFNLDEWNFGCIINTTQKNQDLPSFLLACYQDPDWDEYSSLIQKTDLGFSLTSSSFLLPDYHPLDLAACGAVVVTNFLKNKETYYVHSKNVLYCQANVHEIKRGLARGVDLVHKKDLRLRNFRNNGILKDWHKSFQEVLVLTEKWGFHVPT